MRRLGFTAVFAAALGLTVPGAALARTHGARPHHARGHSRTHRRAGRARTLRLTPASGPTSPDTIGTVAGFQNGTLTLTLTDQSTVTGAVTPDTEFDCVAPAATGQQASVRDAADDGGAGASPSSSSYDQPPPTPPTSSGSDDPAERGDDQAEPSDGSDQEDNRGQPGCDSSLLTQGAMVREAQLRISPTGGSVFQTLELVH